MTDAEKLIVLSKWLDKEAKTGRFGRGASREVQADLLQMAEKIIALDNGGNIPCEKQDPKI